MKLFISPFFISLKIQRLILRLRDIYTVNFNLRFLKSSHTFQMEAVSHSGLAHIQPVVSVSCRYTCLKEKYVLQANKDITLNHRTI